jgi:hypothetical protein
MLTDLSHTVSLKWSSNTYGYRQEMAFLAAEEFSVLRKYFCSLNLFRLYLSIFT